MKIQFKEEGGKRYYNFSTKKLRTFEEAGELKEFAQKDFPQRTFRIKE